MSTADDLARQARWMRTLHRWHWISSAISLVGMLLFAITGLTLNNAGTFERSRPQVTRLEATIPAPLRAGLDEAAELPEALRRWLGEQWRLSLPQAELQAEGSERIAVMPRPGGEGQLRIEPASGRATLELSDRGWIAFFNDLHKGRHAGTVWSWFLDLFAVACLVFCITGLLILQRHAPSRPAVWPLTAAGLVLPLLLVLLFIH